MSRLERLLHRFLPDPRITVYVGAITANGDNLSTDLVLEVDGKVVRNTRLRSGDRLVVREGS